MAGKSKAKGKGTGKGKGQIRKRGYKTNVLVGKSLNPIPQRTIVKMKYAETVATDINGFYNFNLNSIFDPNRTGGGHQPYGRDIYATLYNRYRVISCRYVVQCPNGVNNIQWGCVPTNDIYAFASLDEMKEHPRAKFRSQSINAPVQTITGNVYLPSLMGRTKAQYMADDRYQSDMNNSPQELGVLQIVTAQQTGGIASGNTVQIILEFLVEFFDVKQLSQS